MSSGSVISWGACDLQSHTKTSVAVPKDTAHFNYEFDDKCMLHSEMF